MFNRRLRRKIRIDAHTAADRRPIIIKTTIISLLCLALVITLSVLLGNSLRNRAEQAEDSLSDVPSVPSQTDGDTDSAVTPYDPVSVPTIKAEYVTLSSSVGIDWSARAAELSGRGVTALSMVLYYGEGVVNYSSPVACELGFQAQSNTKTRLDTAMPILRQADIYPAGCFYPTFHTRSPAVSSVIRQYEAALIAEALAAGFLEVTVMGMTADDNAPAYSAQLFGAVRELYPSATLGIALDPSLVTDPNGAPKIEQLTQIADYLALDLSSLKSVEQLTAALEDASAVISEYNLRIIVSSELGNVSELLSAAGYINWQQIPD